MGNQQRLLVIYSLVAVSRECFTLVFYFKHFRVFSRASVAKLCATLFTAVNCNCLCENVKAF